MFRLALADESSGEFVKALERVLLRELGSPEKLRVDAGTRFNSAGFRKWSN